jgi:hypothetical protein
MLSSIFSQSFPVPESSGVIKRLKRASAKSLLKRSVKKITKNGLC